MWGRGGRKCQRVKLAVEGVEKTQMKFPPGNFQALPDVNEEQRVSILVEVVFHDSNGLMVKEFFFSFLERHVEDFLSSSIFMFFSLCSLHFFSLLQVLKISLLGHRKRIIASLAERPYEEPPVKPPRLSQIRVRHLTGQQYCSDRSSNSLSNNLHIKSCE